jgi:hypothetical protein
MEKKFKKCWYCGKKTKDRGGNLFCKKCENLKKRDVPRSELENYFDKV